MKSSTSVANVVPGCRLMWASAVVLALLSSPSTSLDAQSPPPVQGTVALEGTMKKVYRDRKSTRLNSSHIQKSRMPSSA